jgi:hypothetical protein
MDEWMGVKPALGDCLAQSKNSHLKQICSLDLRTNKSYLNTLAFTFN